MLLAICATLLTYATIHAFYLIREIIEEDEDGGHLLRALFGLFGAYLVMWIALFI